MLQNAYLLAKIGADTAENEQQFAEILPKISANLVKAARLRARIRGLRNQLILYTVLRDLH